LVKTRPTVALYGGSFDPPHRGHQAIVQHLRTRPEIDRVILVPAWRNPFKASTLASPAQRLAWCRTLFDAPDVDVDASEIDAGRPVYTIETWDRLKRDGDPRYLVIGSDQLPTVTEWKAFDRLNREATWLVFARPGYDQGYEALAHYERIPLGLPESSTRIRQEGELDAIDPRIAAEVAALLRPAPKGEQ
jgi:nicotinate-nucleotide adenylyltransferase